MFGYGQKRHNKKWGSKNDWINHMCVPHTPGVWKLNGSQCKVNENHPKLIEGSIGMYCRDIMFVYGSKKTKKWGWNRGSKHWKLTWCVYYMHFWCVKTW